MWMRESFLVDSCWFLHAHFISFIFSLLCLRLCILWCGCVCVSLEIRISHYRCSRADTILHRSLMHLGAMMRHTETNVQVMWIVMRLWRWPMIMIITIIVIVILLRRLTLRVLLVFHATILKPNFHLGMRMRMVCICIYVCECLRRFRFNIGFWTNVQVHWTLSTTLFCETGEKWKKNECDLPVFRLNSDSSPTPSASALTHTH